MEVSVKGVLRGLHFQNPNAQGRLVSVLQCEVFDAAVDIWVGSPTFRELVRITLSAENKCQLYVSGSFAHGFLATSEAALFSYKCTDYYNREAEHSLLWNDSKLGIGWPLEFPVLSGKYLSGVRLAEISPEKLPRHEDAAVKKTNQEAEVK